MNYTYRIVLLLFFVQVLSVHSQSIDDENNQANTVISYNDQAVSFIQEENHWQAIQAFERAIRLGGKQGRVARNNIVKFRKQEDLPAHNLLQFGWGFGIGQASNFMFNNGWLFMSLLAVIGIVGLYLMPMYWNWWRVAILGGLSIICLVLSHYQALYVESPDLVIFQKNTDLKEKPYDVSDEKQIVFAGQMAKIEQTYEGYYRVQTDTYENGWVLKEDAVGIWGE